MIQIAYSYETFREDLKTLITKIDQPFDTILGIARGGLCMAQMLGEFYTIRKVYTINTIGYDDTQKRANLEVFNIPDLSSATRVLIVDDIVDSGDTLIGVLDILKKQYPMVTYLTASLFYKRSACIKPTWYVKEPEGWVSFFWSEDLK